VPAENREREELEGNNADGDVQRERVRRNQERQRVQDAAQEGADARDRPADGRVAAARQLARVREPFENAMLIPAPIAVATPAMNASNGLCVWSTIAKIGASVESEPSIRPIIAGWTRCRRN